MTAGRRRGGGYAVQVGAARSALYPLTPVPFPESIAIPSEAKLHHAFKCPPPTTRVWHLVDQTAAHPGHT
ncbi:unnamed protein product [Protopolystoma xenopodis]|uniref:Uncharacterized protein n=1 Tax=Protopolystoma xenopodis TaxID=117903 RepID=A0A3S5B7H3_9PLAT|nr:unnamed protein product [Protopolystoma xenopodis]